MHTEKPSRFTPLGTKRFFTGLVTSRSPLVQPGTRAEERFYGGRPDALWDGSNVEVSADNTLIRRPGHSLFNTLPSPATSLYNFRAPLSSIKTMADTATAVYTVASSGSPVSLFTKANGASQTHFQTVGSQLFMSDGVDLMKWDGTHLWKWGIDAPSAAPSLAITGGVGPTAASSLSATPGGTLTNQGTLFVRTTYVSPFGETQGGAEAYLAVPDNQELVVTAPSTPPSTATGWNCYVSKNAGGETLQNSTPISLNVNYTQSTVPTTTGAVPPGSSSGTYNITSNLGVSYAYCFFNSYTGHVSTASPVSAYTGSQTGVNIGISAPGSTDPQVDKIQIYRTTDGGATYLLLVTIANPGSGTWTYTDSGTPDGNLNSLLQAPQALANNPPPAGLSNLTYFDGRIWGTVGSYLFYSNGPMTTNGSGNESWPPLNFALLPSTITRLVPYPNGMFIFTVDDVWLITAAGATPSIYLPGIGTLSYNSVDYNGSSIYVFTTDRNILCITPGGGVVDLGFGVASVFQGWDPTKVSLSFHVYGHNDNALFVCDGNGHILRLNPNQQPEGGTVSSTLATLSAGATMLTSVETSYGVHQLLVASGNNILYRDWTVNSDNGTPYDAWAVIGSLVLSLPGQLCEVESVTLEAVRVGTIPSLGMLLNEISGSFESLPYSVVDPPQLAESTSTYSRRYYLNQNSAPIVCRHLQMRVDFNQDAVANELISYSLYGALHAE